MRQGECGKEKKILSCTDTISLSAADAQVRTTLAYVDRSIDPLKTCLGCQHVVPGAPDACGSCKVVKGPINPAGRSDRGAKVVITGCAR